MLIRSALAVAAALPGLARAQDCDVPVVAGQYTGTPIVNSMPAVDGAEITYFKIRDPSGQYPCNSSTPLADLSLVNYMSLNSTGQRPLPGQIQRAIVVVAGANRDAWTYEGHILDALALADRDGIDRDSVAVMAPHFANGDDKNFGFPWNDDGAEVWDRSYSAALVWYGSYWSGGAINNYPPKTQTVSSFDVLDQIVQYFGDADRFPQLHQIVLVGHSLGAQMVQRYSAVGKTADQLDVQVPVYYYIGDPNSFGWLADTRPLSTEQCLDDFDLYREGFANYSSYGAEYTQPMTYGADLVAAGVIAIRQNMAKKSIIHGRGIKDFGDDSSGCSPFTTGKDRNERFFQFIDAFRLSCPEPTGAKCDIVDFVDTDHNAGALFSSVAGRTRLFYDNWDGDGSRAYDMGYPRQTEYDDPFPDPAQLGTPLLNTDSDTYAGGMLYRGCWTDTDQAQTVATLPNLTYTGQQNSRDYCTNACSENNFRIAGVRGDQCFCGNNVASAAVEVVTTSCGTVCPGNANQLCGGDTRLSLFSSSSLKK